MEGEERAEKPFFNGRDKEGFAGSAPAAAASIKLSIITVCYNAVSSIETCVRSVVATCQIVTMEVLSFTSWKLMAPMRFARSLATCAKQMFTVGVKSNGSSRNANL
jgi:hypothetical protein